jgi:PIN domain-containing protein
MIRMVSRVYFDTNVLQAAGWPRLSPALKNLFELARTLKVRLFFPQVVKMELEKHWLKKLNEHRSSANSGLRQLRSHLLEVIQVSVPELEPLDEEKVKNDYREFTKALENKWNIETVPLTERLDVLVEMAVNERPPFAKEGKGKGFQNAVIYLSMLDHLGGTREAVFLSNDGGFERIDRVCFLEAGLMLYKEVGEVVDVLAKATKEGKIIIWEHRREATKESMKLQLKDIDKFVNEKLTIPDNIIDFIDSGIANLVVKALKRVDVIDVKDVQIPLDAGVNQTITVSVVLRAKLHVVVGKRELGSAGQAGVFALLMGSPQMLSVGPPTVKGHSPNPSEEASEASPDMEISFEQLLTLEAKATLSTAAATDIEFTSVRLTNPPHDTISGLLKSLHIVS